MAPKAPPKIVQHEQHLPGCALPFFNRLLKMTEKPMQAGQIDEFRVGVARGGVKRMLDRATRRLDPMQKLSVINNSLQQMLQPHKLKTHPRLHLATCEEMLERLKEQLEVVKNADPDTIPIAPRDVKIMLKMIRNGIPEIEDKIKYLMLHGELPPDDREFMEIQLQKK